MTASKGPKPRGGTVAMVARKGPKPRTGTVAMVARCRDCGGEIQAVLVHRERMTVTITGWSHVDELVTCPPGAGG